MPGQGPVPSWGPHGMVTVVPWGKTLAKHHLAIGAVSRESGESHLVRNISQKGPPT